MKHINVGLVALLVPMVMLAGCSDSASPTQASTSVTPPGSPSVSSTTPRPASPASGAQIKFVSQPVTLVVNNAVSTAPEAPTYTFQIATDAAFATVVKQVTGVAPGPNGLTKLTLDRLAGGVRYYWRALIVAAGEPGPVSTVYSFDLGQEVVLQAPNLISPQAGEKVLDKPTLTVSNVQRTGPAGELQYRFEVSESPTFSSLVYSAVVTEGRDSTSHALTKELAEKTYYWRVFASSPANEVVGPSSSIGSFSVQKGIDLRKATIVIGPSNVADWKQAAEITSAYFDPVQEQLCIFHTRLGLWPTALFDNDGTLVEGNQWVFANINGQWIGGAADWYRPGQACKTVNAESIGRDAFYQTPSSPAYSWQPQSGEIFAVMSTTPARSWPSFATWDERSNIVFIRWP